MPVTPAAKPAEWRVRDKCLIVLSDQQRSFAVSPELFGLKSRDRSWNPHIDSFLRANSNYFKALEIEIHFSPGKDEVGVNLNAGGVIGAVPLRAPDTHKIAGGLVVQPRYGWSSLGYLLSAIGWSATPEILEYPLVPGSAKEIPPWVIAGPVIKQLETLLKHSGPRFREVTQLRDCPRGRIHWREYCAQQVSRGNLHLLPCSFSDLEIDQQLQRYIRWSLERISTELVAFSNVDMFAHKLWERVQSMLSTMEAVRPLLPDHRSLDAIQRTLRRQTERAELAIDSIRWILDERGLAGVVDLDGLSWRVRMHELFEQWVETLVRHWAKGFGGHVTCARKLDSLAPIRWERSGTNSLSNLVPDVVVRGNDETFIFDAKYKGFLEELDYMRWRDVSELMREDHRHDIHQVLAYSSMYQASEITVVLVYPLMRETWANLVEHRASLARGTLEGRDRTINLVVAGVPITLAPWISLNAITDEWEVLRRGY
jgi:hypothetical protein